MVTLIIFLKKYKPKYRFTPIINSNDNLQPKGNKYLVYHPLWYPNKSQYYKNYS